MRRDVVIDMTCDVFTHYILRKAFHKVTMHYNPNQRTEYGFPAFKIPNAFPSSLTFGSPGSNSSNFPVCVCGLLKLDPSTFEMATNTNAIMSRQHLLLILVVDNAMVVRLDLI